jgi:hypothetical protein
MSRIGAVRDIVLLVLGTAGIVHQEFIRSTSDSALLMFYAAIFGLTAFLPNGIADAARHRQNGGSPDE